MFACGCGAPAVQPDEDNDFSWGIRISPGEVHAGLQLYRAFKRQQVFGAIL